MTLHAEDLPAGTVVPLGSHRVTAHEIVEFGRMWDPLPMHTDPEAARLGAFGGLIASGVHVFAIYQRLHVDGLLGRTAVIAGRRTKEMRLPLPTRPEDVLTGSVEVLEATMRPARGDAVVTTRSTLVNQDGKLVFDMIGEVLIRTRHTTPVDSRMTKLPPIGR
jgi:acyl dehydratase